MWSIRRHTLLCFTRSRAKSNPRNTEPLHDRKALISKQSSGMYAENAAITEWWKTLKLARNVGQVGIAKIIQEPYPIISSFDISQQRFWMQGHNENPLDTMK